MGWGRGMYCTCCDDLQNCVTARFVWHGRAAGHAFDAAMPLLQLLQTLAALFNVLLLLHSIHLLSPCCRPLPESEVEGREAEGGAIHAADCTAACTLRFGG